MTDYADSASDRARGRTDVTWNVTTDLGATALTVAAQRAAETAQLDPLISDRFAGVLVDAVGDRGWRMIASGDLTWLPATDDSAHRLAKIGREYVATRTVFFDDFCSTATSAGIGQVVILAAGLDARAYRLPCLTGVAVYEVDQPEVLAFKQSALAASGDAPTADLRLVPADLRDDQWQRALAAAGWDQKCATAWLVEGLLPYLTSTEHDELFTTITDLSAAASRVAAEVYHHHSVHLGSKRLDSWKSGAVDINDATGAGVDVTAYIKDGDTSDTAHWLTRHGWTVDALDSRDEMARLGREVPGDLLDVAPASSLVTALLPAR